MLTDILFEKSHKKKKEGEILRDERTEDKVCPIRQVG